jgi:hypothetical protein
MHSAARIKKSIAGSKQIVCRTANLNSHCSLDDASGLISWRGMKPNHRAGRKSCGTYHDLLARYARLIMLPEDFSFRLLL